VWLANVDRELNVGFYDIAIELPLSASAVAGDSLPITVTLNTNAVTVDTTVTGLGLLKSYLMLCPGQDVPQQVGGNTIGTLTDASSVTNVFVGETYCLQHVVPSLPSGVTLTQHALFSNGTTVDMVPGARARARIRRSHQSAGADRALCRMRALSREKEEKGCARTRALSRVRACRMSVRLPLRSSFLR
jgi:hypothetical protein